MKGAIMKRIILSTLTFVLLASSLLLAPHAAISAQKGAAAATPQQAAQSFLTALKKRDLKTATALCDVVVKYFKPYGSMDGYDAPSEPSEVVRMMAANVTDKWIAETNPSRIQVASDGRAYDPKNFFRGESTYYAIADAGVPKQQIEQFEENEKVNVTAANGYVIYLHQVGGKWLIYRVVADGFIGTPR